MKEIDLLKDKLINHLTNKNRDTLLNQLSNLACVQLMATTSSQTSRADLTTKKS